MSDKQSTKNWYTRAELSNGRQLKISHPAQGHAFPFVITHQSEHNIRLSLSQGDAIKVLQALMQAYPLETLAAIE